MGLFDILMQIVGGALLVWLAAVMVRRKLHLEYPFFFAYVAFSLLTTIALLCVSSEKQTYLLVYWAAAAVSAVLVLFALHEVFHDVFYGFYAFWWFRLIFPGVVAIMAFFSIRHAILKPPGHGPRIATVILSLGTAVSFVQAGLFVVFVLLVVLFHVRWRRYPYDIALGFCVSTIGDWTGFALRSEFGNKYAAVTRYAAPVAYICATLFWLWSFSGPFEPEPKLEWKQDISPEQLAADMRELIKIMKKALGWRNGC